jgi:hypothetical protein
MANMSYCMFENTYGDLQDCVARLEEDGYITVLKESNEYERRAMTAMYALCKRYMELIEQQFEEEEFELSPWGDE